MSGSGKAICVSLIFAALWPSLCRGQEKDAATTLSSVLHGEDTLALAPWSVSGLALLCVFNQNGHGSMHDSESIPRRTMVVYRKEGKKLTRIFEAKTADWFFSAYPTRENGRFVVIWGAGSAYHIRVYAYLNGGVREVLDTGSRDLPEFLRTDEPQESILVTAPELVDGIWKNSAGTTAVFKWNGKTYAKIGTVPWSRRFECATAESCIPPR